MIAAAAPDAALGDAALALNLFVSNPARFGGIVLRGDGPVRDTMVAFAAEHIGQFGAVKRIPANVDSDRLLGGLDLGATLAAGRGVTRAGLLDAAAGGALIIPMAERMSAATAAHVAQAMDGGDIAAILLDDSCDSDEEPPPVLMERIAFACDVSAMRAIDLDARVDRRALLSAVAPLDDEQREAIAATAAAYGVASVRALIFAQNASRGHAAFHGRSSVHDDDLAAAVRLVIAPRATQLPPDEPPASADPEPPPAGQPQPQTSSEQEESRSLSASDLDDILLEAVAAAIPPHILDQIGAAAQGGGSGQAGRAGNKQKSTQRGRPLGARPGVPGGGSRLALIETLRAAAPWQPIRRQAARAGDARRIHIRKSDLRVRRYEQRSETLTIFAVDASGSSAMARLAEAKGAVELMLAQAYVKRSQVALIAFRQSRADLLLPPTRSLTRARRALAALPGGGGTPLAAGLLAARQLADSAQRAGQSTTVAVLTDGKANVAMDGSADRTSAMAEAAEAAAALRLMGIASIVIDISPRPRAEAAALAVALGGRYLPLPHAGNASMGAAMVAAIDGLAAAKSMRP